MSYSAQVLIACSIPVALVAVTVAGAMLYAWIKGE